MKNKKPPKVRFVVEANDLNCLWFPCTTAPRESVLALLMVSLLPKALKISKTESLVSMDICCTFTPSRGMIPRGLFSFLLKEYAYLKGNMIKYDKTKNMAIRILDCQNLHIMGGP